MSALRESKARDGNDINTIKIEVFLLLYYCYCSNYLTLSRGWERGPLFVVLVFVIQVMNFSDRLKSQALYAADMVYGQDLAGDWGLDGLSMDMKKDSRSLQK